MTELLLQLSKNTGTNIRHFVQREVNQYDTWLCLIPVFLVPTFPLRCTSCVLCAACPEQSVEVLKSVHQSHLGLAFLLFGGELSHQSEVVSCAHIQESLDQFARHGAHQYVVAVVELHVHLEGTFPPDGILHLWGVSAASLASLAFALLLLLVVRAGGFQSRDPVRDPSHQEGVTLTLSSPITIIVQYLVPVPQLRPGVGVRDKSSSIGCSVWRSVGSSLIDTCSTLPHRRRREEEGRRWWCWW